MERNYTVDIRRLLESQSDVIFQLKFYFNLREWLATNLQEHQDFECTASTDPNIEESAWFHGMPVYVHFQSREDALVFKLMFGI